MLGVVPHTGAPHPMSTSASFSTPSFLTFDANYANLINQYFTDVAAASSSATNVYSIATQYYDSGYAGSGPVQYQSVFGGSYVDTDPLPANGCNDSYLGTSDPVCLTDAQLQAEIQKVLTTKGWHGSNSTMFFLMTPNGVGSCVDGTPPSSGGQCSTNVYCAYHSAFIDSNGEPVIYANEPYDATIAGCFDPIDGQGTPNSDDADIELNTVSHEHNEAITDPFGEGWWTDDPKPSPYNGYENGDLCAWTFGPALGTVSGQPYNQIINGHDYSLQQEYSNNGSACFQNAGQEVAGPPSPSTDLVYHGGFVMHTNATYAIYWLPTPGNSGAPVVTGTALVGQTLASTLGSWTGSPTSYAYQWQRCSPAGTGCTNIPGATGSTYTLASGDGGNTVRSTVSATNVNGASTYAPSATTGVVVPVPAATAPPSVSGVAAVGKTLATTTGTWNTSASFTYQWQRCAANGGTCVAIAGATASTYPLLTLDGGHTLRAVVTATNAAGAASATSGATAIVVAVPKATAAPRIRGKATVGRRITASHGSWSGPPATFRFQWLRCSPKGTKCHPIKKATRARYRLTKHDTGHRLRVRITALNTAGSGAAISRSTKRVPTARRH